MIRRRRRKPLRKVFLIWLIVYGLILIGGACALWWLVPPEVKKTIYETYINPP